MNENERVRAGCIDLNFEYSFKPRSAYALGTTNSDATYFRYTELFFRCHEHFCIASRL